MWELISAKAAAQRAVFDKEALFKNVEEVMSEAVSAQMQVAQSLLQVEREPLVETVPGEEAVTVPTIAGLQLTMDDLFERHGPQPVRRRRVNTEPVPATQMTLFGQAA